jgi:hypothetical protein
MKKYGYDVLIGITSGQIHGNEYNDDNYVMVRFDKDKPIKYWFDESSDNSSDIVFIRKITCFQQFLIDLLYLPDFVCFK